MMKLVRYIVLCLGYLFCAGTANSATVECGFMSGEIYDASTGEWSGSVPLENIWEIFGMEDISLPLENTLLANLDTGAIFTAGKIDKGTVYLMGSEMGVEGRLTNVQDGQIHIYSGFCTVGFG